MLTRRMVFLGGTAGLLGSAGTARAAENAVCYNCPPEWADWASVIRAIYDTTGISVPFDDKNSGQALAAVIAERANPVADVLYLGG